MTTFTLYTVTFTAPDSSTQRAEGCHEKLSQARKLATKLSECSAFSDVTVWAGQPGGMRA